MKQEFQFTAVPTKLMLLLDNNCRSMLFTLIQLSSCYANEDGYFFRSNNDLQEESNLSKNLVIVTIDTLYVNGIIDVKCVGSKCRKISNYYKLNYGKIIEYDNMSIEDTKNPDNKIKTLNYKNSDYVPTYKTATNTAMITAKSEHQKPQKVNTNIDNINIDNIENKDIIYNINLKENLTSIYKEKLEKILTNYNYYTFAFSSNAKLIISKLEKDIKCWERVKPVLTDEVEIMLIENHFKLNVYN